MECERGSKVGITRSLQNRLMNLGHERVKAKRVVMTWHRPDDARDVEMTACALMGSREPLNGQEHFDVPADLMVAKVEAAIEMVDRGKGWLSYRRRP